MYEVEKVSNGWILRVYSTSEGALELLDVYVYSDSGQVFAKLHALMEGLK